MSSASLRISVEHITHTSPCAPSTTRRYSTRRTRTPHCSNSAESLPTRRAAVLLIATIWQVAKPSAGHSKPQVGNKEVDDNSSALIQGLLAKSKANKDQYTKDRLNDYYRRNYRDYFNTEKGLGGSRNERGVSNENQQKILEWLKNNP